MDAAFLKRNVLVGIPTRIQVSRCRENLLGQYPTVTDTPAGFILRIGWAKRSPPGWGILRVRVLPAWRALVISVFLLGLPIGRKSLDRSRKLSCNSIFFDFGRPLRDRGPTPSNNFPEMKRMQGQKPLSSPGA